MIHEFGTRLDGVDYIYRPGAYAVIMDGHGQVAVIRTYDGYFLPGGGIEAGEAHIDALRREVLEEIGYQIFMVNKIGEAVEYIQARAEGTYYQIQGTFFRVHLGVRLDNGGEEDHQLIWLPQEDVVKRLTRQSQVWAVQCA